MRRLTWGEIAAVITAGVVAVGYGACGGEMFSPGALNATSKTGSAPGGVQSHAQLGGNCSACHAPLWSQETMADRCLSCHSDVGTQLAGSGPLHGLLANGRECRACHTEHQGAHVALTNFAHFDHDCAAFKLTGAHRAVECKACHVGTSYKGTSQACSACHAEPVVHLGRFGTGCATCHSTTNWTSVAGAGAGLPNFDHASTGFKLTGAHQSINCKGCHTGNGFKGLSSSCVSCHAEPLVPVVHKARYGVGCTGCHSTATFRGATFTHAFFSVNHGKRNNTCATCHQDSSNFALYTCYNCHEHTPEKEARRHARRNVAKLDNCIDCHARNRPRRVADGLDALLPATCRAEPEEGWGWPRLSLDAPRLNGSSYSSQCAVQAVYSIQLPKTADCLPPSSHLVRRGEPSWLSLPANSRAAASSRSAPWGLAALACRSYFEPRPPLEFAPRTNR